MFDDRAIDSDDSWYDGFYGFYGKDFNKDDVTNFHILGEKNMTAASKTPQVGMCGSALAVNYLVAHQDPVRFDEKKEIIGKYVEFSK
jgi:hypothetical protein